MVGGLWSTVALGVLGGLLAQTLPLLAAYRTGTGPSRQEVIASGCLALMGAGVALLGIAPRRPFETAVLGAAFPQLFSSAVAVASSAKPSRKRGPRADTENRRLVDFLARRF